MGSMNRIRRLKQNAPRKRHWLWIVPAVLFVTVVFPFLWRAPHPSSHATLSDLVNHGPLQHDERGPKPSTNGVIDTAAAAALKTAAAAAGGDGTTSSSSSSGGGVLTWMSSDQISSAGAYLSRMSRARAKDVLPATKYVIEPEPWDMRKQLKEVKAYLSSAAFRSAMAERRKGPARGIIINGGGRKMLSSAIVTLKVLREVHNCSLPVELVWHTPDEMDGPTLAALEQQFAPLRGYNVSDMPWPKHQRQHRPDHAIRAEAPFVRFERKVRSLLHSRFQSALLLDADNIPLLNPELLFQDPEVVEHGAMFWPDFWARTDHKEVLYDMVGLEYQQALDAITAGKGPLLRDTESGQLLLDLVRHGDVVEVLVWINSWGEQVYRAVWGDKDTYAMAFAVAGKAEHFTQVQVPPGGSFTWRPDMLLIKATQQKTAGWQLGGMLQFDNRGRPAFLHRTINKFWYGVDAWHLGMITGPLPYRWVHYYLDQETLGPTVGVPYDYVVPASALIPWRVNAPLMRTRAHGAEWRTEPVDKGCPITAFLDYWRMREAGLPLGAPLDPNLITTCWPLLHHLMGPETAQRYMAAGLAVSPEAAVAADETWDQLALQRHHNPLIKAIEVGDGTPVAAWEADYMRPGVETGVTAALRESYEAFQWLKEHVKEFPVVDKGP